MGKFLLFFGGTALIAAAYLAFKVPAKLADAAEGA